MLRKLISLLAFLLFFLLTPANVSAAQLEVPSQYSSIQSAINAAQNGDMINIGAGNIMTGEWWPSVFPGLALMFSVLGFALVGDSLHWLLQAKRV